MKIIIWDLLTKNITMYKYVQISKKTGVEQLGQQ